MRKGDRAGKLPAVWLFAVLVLPGIALAPVASGAAGTGDAERARQLVSQADAIYDKRTGAEDVRKAYELYKQAFTADPNSYEAAWKAGRAAWQLAELVDKPERRSILEEGRDIARRAVELKADGVDGHYWYGVLIGRVGEERGVLVSLFMVDDVVREMETVVRLDPTHAGAHHVLGVLYRVVPGRPLSIGDKKKAVEHAELAVRYAPDDVLYRLGLGEAYQAAGDREAAIRVYREVLAMEVKDPVNDVANKERARQHLKELGENP